MLRCALSGAARRQLTRRGPLFSIGDVSLPLFRPEDPSLVPTVGAPDDPFASSLHPSTRGFKVGPSHVRVNTLFPAEDGTGAEALGNGAFPAGSESAFEPRGIEDSPETIAHLRWMAQKDLLGQDMFLIGPPGSYRRRLALRYCELALRECEIVSITPDTTESDLKQRREITGGDGSFSDGAPVRAAIRGRVLILDGIERAERNVLPVLNNLLENREMGLEDGRFLLSPERYDEIRQQGTAASGTVEIDAPLAAAVGGGGSGDKTASLVRVSERFRVIALGTPPSYSGSAIDPPLRSRFQGRAVRPPPVETRVAVASWRGLVGSGGDSAATTAASSGSSSSGGFASSIRKIVGGASPGDSSSSETDTRIALVRATESLRRFASGRAAAGVPEPPEASDLHALRTASLFPHTLTRAPALLHRSYPFTLMNTGSAMERAVAAAAEKKRNEEMSDGARNGASGHFSNTPGDTNSEKGGNAKASAGPESPLETVRRALERSGVHAGGEWDPEAIVEPAETCGAYHVARALHSSSSGAAVVSFAHPSERRAVEIEDTSVQAALAFSGPGSVGTPSDDGKAASDDRANGNTGRSTGSSHPAFVPTASHSAAAAAVTQALLSGRNACLVGDAGSGKSAVVREVARILGYETSDGDSPIPAAGVETVTLYKDMTGRDLLQRRGSSRAGDTLWADSPLVKAARTGRLAVLDGVDRVSDGTLAAIASLLGDGDVALPDGTRLVHHSAAVGGANGDGGDGKSDGVMSFPVHPRFRVVALGSPPTRDNAWVTDDTAALFDWAVLPSACTDTERAVIRGCLGLDDPEGGNDSNVSTNADATVDAVVAVSAALRDAPDLPALTTRQLLRVARRAVLHPGDLAEAVRNTLAAKYMPRSLRESLENTLGRCLDSRFDDRAEDDDTGAEAMPIESSGGTLSIGGVTVPLSEPEHPELVPSVVFHPVRSHVALLREMLKDYAAGEHILLLGSQGTGKNRLTDHLLSLLNREREYLQLHRDTTVHSLTVRAAVQAGRVVWEDSPLVRAVRHGRVLVVDEADKAPGEVVCVIKNLLEDGGMHLADGRRIVRAGDAGFDPNDPDVIVTHPAFRVIALANISTFPFHGNDFYKETGGSFACHPVANPDVRSECALVRGYAPSVPEGVVERLGRGFGALRELAERGNLQYPYSMRELVGTVRHLDRFPGDGVAAALGNVFSHDAFDGSVTATVSRVFAQAGVPFGHGDGGGVSPGGDDTHVDTAPEVPITDPAVIAEARALVEAAGPSGQWPPRLSVPIDWAAGDGSVTRDLGPGVHEHSRERSFSECVEAWHVRGEVVDLETGADADSTDDSPVDVVHVLSDTGALRSFRRSTMDCAEHTTDLARVLWGLRRRRGAGKTIRAVLGDADTADAGNGSGSGESDPASDLEQGLVSHAVSGSVVAFPVSDAVQIPPSAPLHAAMAGGRGTRLMSIDTESATCRVLEFDDAIVGVRPAAVPGRFVVAVAGGAVRVLELSSRTLGESLREWRYMHGIDVAAAGKGGKGSPNGSGGHGGKPALNMRYIPPPPMNAKGSHHGKIDPDNAPHVGGNTWAGGTGGSSTAGLGGRGGPYRLDAGHDIHQISDMLKHGTDDYTGTPTDTIQRLSDGVREDLDTLGAEAFRARLKEIGMSQHDHAAYERFALPVMQDAERLRAVLRAVKSREKERVWLRGQTFGELDEMRIVDGIAGESNVFRRRGRSDEQNNRADRARKHLTLVVDLSGSMYRFEQYDQRLTNQLRAMAMFMEALDGPELADLFSYNIVGHSGDGAGVPLVDWDEGIVRTEADRLRTLNTAVAHSQYCMPGDATVAAIRKAVADIAERGKRTDGKFVIVLSDANFERYGIDPARVARELRADDTVDAFLFMIGGIDDEARRTEELMEGKGFDVKGKDLVEALRRALVDLSGKGGK